jgi:CheY-like chemotaxis protein
LLLPRASELVETDPEARPAVELRRNFPSNLVLVVDDDHAVRQVTVEMLKDLGCDTAQAAGGNEALSLIDEMRRGPDLILLDYAMPGMNGLQLARTLRAQGIAAPMALVTGYAELAEAEGGSGVLDALLRKPFTIRELDATLARLRRRARTDAKVVSLRG